MIEIVGMKIVGGLGPDEKLKVEYSRTELTIKYLFFS
jgi:hypothetical protein